MLWVIILSLFLLLSWLLFSELELKLDTRIPAIWVQWISIGKVTLVYEREEWWLKIRILFYRKKWSLLYLILSPAKTKKQVERISRKKNKPARRWLPGLFKMLTSFQIKEWQLAIDTGDYSQNAMLYPLNYFSNTRQHVQVNFINENFLVLRITNTLWRILYSLIK